MCFSSSRNVIGLWKQNEQILSMKKSVYWGFPNDVLQVPNLQKSCVPIVYFKDKYGLRTLGTYSL